jgi:protoheme IX farnesyltransferase
MLSSSVSPIGGGRDGSRLSSVLGLTVVGLYLLIVLGATNAIADAAAACPEWPVCSYADLTHPGVLLALGHRVVAALVGLVLLFTTVSAWRNGAPWRVRIALLAALGLFPAQIAIGAIATVSGASGAIASLHLVAGMVIFTFALVALALQLEEEVPDDASEPLVSEGGIGTPERPDLTAEPTESDGATGVSSASAGATLQGTSTTGITRVGERAKAYIALTKPRLMWLLCLVALASMALAAGGVPQLDTAFGTVLGGMLAIGASGTFNNVLERDVDRYMARTADRPVAVGEVPVPRATVFGFALTAGSLATFLAFTNALAAALGLVAILFYSVVYTLVLKPQTTQNTVLGGAVGAFPALIGWAAVTGSVDVAAVALGGVIFLWTPAHFYNLALAYVDDYRRAGFPMLPVVHGPAVTRRHILWYLGATLLATAALAVLTSLDWLFAASMLVLGVIFLWTVLRLHRERTERAALRAFHASNAYLGGVLVAIVVDVTVV